jgi:hypothetical protein
MMRVTIIQRPLLSETGGKLAPGLILEGASQNLHKLGKFTQVRKIYTSLEKFTQV